MSCVAAPATCRSLHPIPLCSALCHSPLCLMPPQLSNNALSLQPLHRQHVAYTSHLGRGCFSDFVLDPIMTHCLRQQPLAQIVRTPHLQSQSCLGLPRPHFSICLTVHTSKLTRGSRCLAAAHNSEWFPSFGPTTHHAITSTPG